ncbi:MAG: formyltransferase [Steroidobacteraceae bacterium]
MTAARAVVFGYHDVGVRCLKALISGGVQVPLVVTVADDPNETQWFGSVAATAAEYGITAITPADANTPELQRTISDLQPDFIFSFYYRSMLGAPLLRIARRGALNMHGSMLPKYRGRAPVNWAILRGERETGATLHYMVERADAGEIVDQLAVPILRDDDARDVFAKVTVAAETVLARSLPGLIAGTAPRRTQPIEPGQYFGRRRPEDGRIDWSWPAEQVHNLVRAVAPPFPGAFADVQGERWWVHKTRVAARTTLPNPSARLVGSHGQCQVECRDGSVLQLLAVATAAGPLNLQTLANELSRQPRLLV